MREGGREGKGRRRKGRGGREGGGRGGREGGDGGERERRGEEGREREWGEIKGEETKGFHMCTCSTCMSCSYELEQ